MHLICPESLHTFFMHLCTLHTKPPSQGLTMKDQERIIENDMFNSIHKHLKVQLLYSNILTLFNITTRHYLFYVLFILVLQNACRGMLLPSAVFFTPSFHSYAFRFLLESTWRSGCLLLTFETILYCHPVVLVIIFIC